MKFRANSVATIYASHVFEHIPRNKKGLVLSEWFRVLKTGGKIYILVPDLEKLATAYLINVKEYGTSQGRSRADLAAGIIFGGQSNRFDFHYYGYSFSTLRAILEEVGFRDVEIFDRGKLDFAPFKDAGYAAIDGKLVSLNVVAVK